MSPVNGMSNTYAKIQQPSEAGFPWRILVASIIIFGITVLLYLGMTFGYAPYLNSQIASVNSQFSKLTQSLDEQQQQDLIGFYSQLYNIKTLSAIHLYPSRFFDFLEKNTYSNVRISSAQVGASNGEIKLEGIASDYDVLTNQISAFKFADGVSDVMLESSKARSLTDGGGISFAVRINFTGGFFSGNK
jgi:CBS domain-containing protein